MFPCLPITLSPCLPFPPLLVTETAPVVHQPAEAPLPEILDDGQVQRLLETTQALLADADNPDPRPHLLVALLAPGIKRGECMPIRLEHLDRSDRDSPVHYVRYANPRMRKKERKLQLPPELPSLLERYLAQYQPQERLFECTGRNLEYILRDAAGQAGIPGGIAFETLRRTCAVRDYRAGMPLDTLRQKLGLSPVTWQYTAETIRQLAGPVL